MVTEIAVRLDGITSGYNKLTVLWDVTLEIRKGEVLGVFGPNGAGKTTLLRTISRLTTIFSGSMEICGIDATRLRPTEISRMGVAHVPEGRRVFRGMTVEDNLLVSSRLGRRKTLEELGVIYDLFPRLQERYRQKAENLSGGEQQMLAIGRALMMKPSLIMLDEPSQGLSPAAAQGVADALERIAKSGVTVIVVEQNVHVVLPIVSVAAIVSRGCVRLVDDISELSSGSGLADLLGGDSNTGGEFEEN